MNTALTLLADTLLADSLVADTVRTTPAPNQWPARIALVALLAGVVVLGVWGMRRGWRNRAARQSDLLPLPASPAQSEQLLAPTEGLYVGTARAGDWQDRIVAGGLGHRSSGSLSVCADGVQIERVAAGPVFIPAFSIRQARTDNVGGGRILGTGGLLIVGWEHNGIHLDTAFRADDKTTYPLYVEAIRSLQRTDVQVDQEETA